MSVIWLLYLFYYFFLTTHMIMKLVPNSEMITYVASCIEDDTTPEQVYQNFVSEFVYASNIARYKGNTQLIFSEWLKGLPNYINIAFYNHDIINLGYLFDYLSADSTEDEESKFVEQWFKLCASAFFQIYKSPKSVKLV